MKILSTFSTINANDNSNFNKKIQELDRKVGELYGRVISLSSQLIQERAKMRQLCDYLSVQSEEDDFDDFLDDEEGWVKL